MTRRVPTYLRPVSHLYLVPAGTCTAVPPPLGAGTGTGPRPSGLLSWYKSRARSAKACDVCGRALVDLDNAALCWLELLDAGRRVAERLQVVCEDGDCDPLGALTLELNRLREPGMVEGLLSDFEWEPGQRARIEALAVAVTPRSNSAGEPESEGSCSRAEGADASFSTGDGEP